MAGAGAGARAVAGAGAGAVGASEEHAQQAKLEIAKLTAEVWLLRERAEELAEAKERLHKDCMHCSVRFWSWVKKSNEAAPEFKGRAVQPPNGSTRRLQ